jgi:hypothetical protein
MIAPDTNVKTNRWYTEHREMATAGTMRALSPRRTLACLLGLSVLLAGAGADEREQLPSGVTPLSYNLTGSRCGQADFLRPGRACDSRYRAH